MGCKKRPTVRRPRGGRRKLTQLQLLHLQRLQQLRHPKNEAVKERLQVPNGRELKPTTISPATLPTASQLYFQQRRGVTLLQVKTEDDTHPYVKSEDVKVKIEEGSSDDDDDDGGDIANGRNVGNSCLVCLGQLTGNRRSPGRPKTNKHLRSMFLIRTLLQFPEEECYKMLSAYKISSSSSWYSLCEACCVMVKNAEEIHQEILELEEQMSTLRDNIKEKMFESLKREGGRLKRNEKARNISQEIHQYIRAKLFSTNQDERQVEGIEDKGSEMDISTEEEPCLPCAVEINEEVCGDDPLQDIPSQNRNTTSTLLGDNFFDDVFRQPYNVDKIEKVKEKVTRRHMCEECGRRFQSTALLEEHQAYHLNNNKGVLICEECGLNFTARQGLRKHIKTFHSYPTERNPTHVEALSLPSSSLQPARNGPLCKHCNVGFVNRRMFKLHLKTVHNDLYTHKCDLCDASYMTSHNLSIHKQSAHSKEKAKCEYCGSEFTSYISIYEHLRKYCKKYDGKGKATRKRKQGIEDSEATTKQSEQVADYISEAEQQSEQVADNNSEATVAVVELGT